jgi:hypothetical protein
MHTAHEYILPGSDRAAVLRYEEKVYLRAGPPRAMEFGERVLSPKEGDDAVARANRLLAMPLPSPAALRNLASSVALAASMSGRRPR